MMTARLGYKAEDDFGEHYARLDFEWKSQSVRESVLEKITENGVTIVTDHGSNIIQRRDMFTLCPSYEYVTGKWEVSADADLTWKNGLASQMYPYIYTQSLMTVALKAGGLVRFGGFELSADAVYGFGKVSEEQRIAGMSMEALSAPYRLQEWYDQQMEYDTAEKIGADLVVRYDFKKGLYLKTTGSWMHGFDLEYAAGSDRFAATLGLGYSF